MEYKVNASLDPWSLSDGGWGWNWKGRVLSDDNKLSENNVCLVGTKLGCENFRTKKPLDQILA